MKKLISFAFVLGLMMFTVLSVKADGMDLKSVETIIAEIRQDQNIANTDPINISKVTSARLEELGDSVMEEVIGNTEVHDRMDTALGGDGSANLTNVHIRVGYNYLAGVPITMMTFMGAGGMMSFGGMMGQYGYFPQGYNYSGYGSMMSGYAVGWMVAGLLGLVALIIGIAYLVTRSLKHKSISTGSDALDILEIRYAHGEITHDEFKRMSEHLK
jgi:uncharacterized membrane protein